MAIDYRRMAMEVESPEQLGYEAIRSNLAESSVADMRLRDLSVALDELVLMYGDHAGHPGLRALVAADDDGLTANDVLLVAGAAAALFIVATTMLAPSGPMSPSWTCTTRTAGASTSIVCATC